MPSTLRDLLEFAQLPCALCSPGPVRRACCGAPSASMLTTPEALHGPPLTTANPPFHRRLHPIHSSHPHSSPPPRAFLHLHIGVGRCARLRSSISIPSGSGMADGVLLQCTAAAPSHHPPLAPTPSHERPPVGARAAAHCQRPMRWMGRGLFTKRGSYHTWTRGGIHRGPETTHCPCPQSITRPARRPAHPPEIVPAAASQLALPCRPLLTRTNYKNAPRCPDFHSVLRTGAAAHRRTHGRVSSRA